MPPLARQLNTCAGTAPAAEYSLDDVTVLTRVRYLVDTFFFSDTRYASLTLGIERTKFIRLLSRAKKFTAADLSRIVLRLGVRTEWLLFGTGAVFARDEVDATERPHLARTIHSAFAYLNEHAEYSPPARQFCGPPGWRSAEAPVPEDTELFFAAARAVYTAHAAKKPFGFFLGCEAAAQNIFEAVMTLFGDYGAQFLVTTLAAARRDAQRVNFHLDIDASLSQIAQTAACNGVGYAEAFGQWAQMAAVDDDRSLLSSLYAAKIPAAILVEFGEIFEHFLAPVYGAEVGSAAGAAAQVDLLIAAKQFEQFFHTTEGVICVAGEEERALRFLYRQAALFPNRSAKFTAIIFAPPSARLAALVSGCGGTPIFLSHEYGPAMTLFLRACKKVYAG